MVCCFRVPGVMKWPLHSLLYIKIHIHHSGDHSADFALDTLRFCCGGKWLRFCFLYCVFFGFLLQGPSVDRHAFPDVAKGVVTEQAMTTPMIPFWETWTIPARSTGDASEPTFMAGNVGLFMKESKARKRRFQTLTLVKLRVQSLKYSKMTRRMTSHVFPPFLEKTTLRSDVLQ